VTILAVSDLFIGIGLFLLGGLMSEPCPPDTECHLTGLVNSLATFPLIIGVSVIVVGYGLWSGSTWGWRVSVALANLGILFVIIGVTFFVWAFGGNVIVPIVLLFAILSGNVAARWYLRRPHVKAYFGKR